MSTSEPWPVITDPDACVQFTIYERPLDFPESFVVRRWFILPGGKLTCDVVPRIAPTLEGARAWLPIGLTRLDRSPGDDPAIREVWI